MALPFLDSGLRRKRDQMLVVDLGGRTTKAIHIQRRGRGMALCNYALLDAPIFERTISAELITEHLKAVVQALQAKTKWVALTVGVNDALVRHAEMPRLSVDDLRMALKHSSRAYLQQELNNHLFDCQVLQSEPAPKVSDPTKAPAGPPKQKVLVAAARKQLVDDYVHGARRAGLMPEHVVPTLIGPVNALEKALPDVFANEAVALVDLGFRNSFIAIVQQGHLILSRVVGIGGDRLTNGLAEALKISYGEAEGIKVGMPGEVQAHLEPLIMPLGREFRASIDFFEHQQDRPVTKVFITGAAARSEVIVRALQQEMLIDCAVLNPTSFLQLELSPMQTAELEQVAPQLTIAIGAAVAAF
jgi:type IV pilus assembly protein PilM